MLRGMTEPFLYKFVQTPKLIVMLWEGNPPGVPQIFMDGRQHPSNADPSWMGHSTGKWEGDTLIVDTVSFNDRSWLGLYPHTEMLHVIERYRRTDFGHMEKETIIEDSGTFTKAWKIHTVWDLALNEEIQEYICNENNQDIGHIIGE